MAQPATTERPAGPVVRLQEAQGRLRDTARRLKALERQCRREARNLMRTLEELRVIYAELGIEFVSEFGKDKREVTADDGRRKVDP